MKKALAIALAIVFVLAFAVPAFAQSMVHTVKEEYVDAVIDIERQHGHLCNTGAELKYSVKGSAAEFMAERTITQVAGKITVSKDEAAWVAGATPLTVTSVIELCAPAKHEWDAVNYIYDPATGEYSSWTMASGVVPPLLGYEAFGWGDTILWSPTGYSAAELAALLGLGAEDFLAGVAAGSAAYDAARIAYWMANGTFAGFNPSFSAFELEALTEQIWAVQVQSDPGFSGNLNQTWEAAYGGYAGVLDEGAAHPDFHAARFAFQYDGDDTDGVGVSLGSDYVGNYFNIEQHARVSQGHVYRYIDISSPFSHAYVSEYSEVTGKADVQEAFAMGNLGPGSDVATDWWELF